MPLKEAVEELETQLIQRGMQKYGTADKLSKVLGVSPATISRRMKKLK
jgi:transcriptional regulator with PAS, ATPase and Fis domain